MIYYILAGSIFLYVVIEFLQMLIFKHELKKSNFDCSKCQVGACYKKYCDKKRKEFSE